MKTEPSILVATLLLAIGPAVASAQGTAFTYQGRLNDGYGPASGLYDLRFAIYDAPSSGNVVGGPLTNGAAAVSEGLFTAILDFGAAPFTGAERWLEIGVRTNGAGPFTNLWPRQPITSTPYAIRAANFSGPVAASQLTGTISSNNIGAGTIHSAMLAAGAVTTTALADGAVTAAKLGTVTVPVSLITITNPTPAASDFFGSSVAMVGTDRVLIGAPLDDTAGGDAGAAYLFNASGSLLVALTNPTPARSVSFGSSVAPMGNDRVLIGAPNEGFAASFSGAAYLFSTNGALLATFTNPTPASLDQFGNAVAAVGNDGVLIGARFDDTGATDAGAAYLFNANGALVTTFTNPTPSNFAYFGTSVAGVGSDRVLVGAPFADLAFVDAGAAYLFSTNGALLTTFINPTPFANDKFGSVVEALGNDRVLIGAPGDNVGANGAGVAYLFGVDGRLLTTFTDPAPAANDQFGFAVAAAGTDRVVIGANSDDAGATNAGTVYLFSTNGTLLMTFTNPTPTSGAEFGNAVAAVGSDRVLIGARFDDTGATNTGAAYLFRVDSYVPGLVAEAVRVGGVSSESIAAGAVTSAQLAAGAVTTAKLADGAVTTAVLADGAVTAAQLAVATKRFALTLFNPTPAAFDSFGGAVAAVGSDKVLIGAVGDDTGTNDAGAAYLFSINGALLTTITNPTPASGDQFGCSVAAVGRDRLLIGALGDDTGAPDTGAAYLFSINGTLLTTITNPTPANADEFGYSVAAVGTDRLLVGAPFDDAGVPDAGAAYLFSTNGALLTTFSNPTPASGDRFGYFVAPIGNDRLLIGAPYDDAGAPDAGVVYLFGINGALLTTFTNPTPAANDNFGVSVAAVGSDRVLIGAFGDDTGATNAGAAYLFSTNGTLLTTITNPTPAVDDSFGVSVASVGNDRLLIGAYFDDVGTDDAGAAYLFSADGTLLMTLTNPTPAASDFFGVSVASVGNDRLLIGASHAGGANSGAVHLFINQTFTPGLVAEGVRAGSISTASLENGAVATAKLADSAVTAAKLDPAIGVWTQSGNNVFRSAGNVGIGTTNPQVPLHIRVTGPVIFLQDAASAANQAGFISFRNDALVETAWVGFGTPSSPTFSVVNARSGGNIELSPFSGNVGIKRTPAANALEVEGNASKTVTGSWLANSDARIKTGVRTVTGALDKLSQVRLVQFRYTDEYRAQHPGIKDRSYLNVVAQEFQKVFPDDVQSSGEKLPGGDAILQVDTYPLTIYSAAAIQELNRKVEQKETEITELKQRLEKLEHLINQKTGGAK